MSEEALVDKATDGEEEPSQRSDTSMPVPPVMMKTPTGNVPLNRIPSERKNTGESTAKKPSQSTRDSSISGEVGSILSLLWNRVFRRYYAMKLIGMLLAVYTAALSFTHVGTFGKFGGVIDPETGYIIDTMSEENTKAGVLNAGGVKRAVIAATSFELVALAVARLTAFYMYPGTFLCTLIRQELCLTEC